MSEGDEFQRLLDAMPRMGEVIEKLPEQLRERAFEELMSTFRGERPPAERGTKIASTVVADQDEADVDEQPAPGRAAGAKARKTAKGAPRKAKPKQVTPMRDFNFWPEGAKSFPDLVQEKAPATNHERNLVAVYWLEQIAQVEVSLGHVLAAYKAANWREPANPPNSLAITAHRTHWLDTAEMKAIKTTHSGRVKVDHDLPAPKAPPTKRAAKK